MRKSYKNIQRPTPNFYFGKCNRYVTVQVLMPLLLLQLRRNRSCVSSLTIGCMSRHFHENNMIPFLCIWNKVNPWTSKRHQRTTIEVHIVNLSRPFLPRFASSTREGWTGVVILQLMTSSLKTLVRLQFFLSNIHCFTA